METKTLYCICELQKGLQFIS